MVGAADDPAAAEMVRATLESAPLGTVLTRGDGSDDGGIPLLTGRGTTGGRATAYVCEGFTCKLPVTTVEDLRAQFG